MSGISVKWLAGMMLLVVLLTAGSGKGAGSAEGAKSAERPIWEALELASMQISGRTVYYEKSLEAQMAGVRPVYEQILTVLDQRDAMADKSERIIDRIEQIVGGGQQPERRKTLQTISQGLSKQMMQSLHKIANVPFCLVNQDTCKDYLRRGGTLPDFTYDKETDKIAYTVNFGSGQTPACLVYPISDKKPLKEQVTEFLSAFKHVQPIDMIFHEMAEAAIVKRLRPNDPYFRWFSDGFATVIAIQLVKEFVGEEAARASCLAIDVKPYADLEKKLNLYYWMGLSYCIDTSLESENQLTLARYAYAALEAQRLVDQYGFDKVSLILDKAGSDLRNNSRGLFAAIEAVTGEDMRKRLDRYQSFENKEQGLREYSTAFNQATAEHRYADAVSNLLRVMELRDDTYDVRSYANAAYLLFCMGREDLGDKAMQEQLNWLKNRSPIDLKDAKGLYDSMQLLFVDYALKCDKPLKAIDVAQQVIINHPQSTPAMAVLMAYAQAMGKMDSAREMARKIIDLDKSGSSPAVQLARKVLKKKDELRL